MYCYMLVRSYFSYKNVLGEHCAGPYIKVQHSSIYPFFWLCGFILPTVVLLGAKPSWQKSRSWVNLMKRESSDRETYGQMDATKCIISLALWSIINWVAQQGWLPQSILVCPAKNTWVFHSEKPTVGELSKSPINSRNMGALITLNAGCLYHWLTWKRVYISLVTICMVGSYGSLSVLFCSGLLLWQSGLIANV